MEKLEGSQSYLEDKPDISKFKHSVAPDGEVEVLDIQRFGVEDVQPR